MAVGAVKRLDGTRKQMNELGIDGLMGPVVIYREK